jgi:hypothetical protein
VWNAGVEMDVFAPIEVFALTDDIFSAWKGNVSWGARLYAAGQNFHFRFRKRLWNPQKQGVPLDDQTRHRRSVCGIVALKLGSWTG